MNLLILTPILRVLWRACFSRSSFIPSSCRVVVVAANRNFCTGFQGEVPWPPLAISQPLGAIFLKLVVCAFATSAFQVCWIFFCRYIVPVHVAPLFDLRYSIWNKLTVFPTTAYPIQSNSWVTLTVYWRDSNRVGCAFQRCKLVWPPYVPLRPRVRVYSNVALPAPGLRRNHTLRYVNSLLDHCANCRWNTKLACVAEAVECDFG